MSPWGWSPERTQGVWRHGAPWMRPAVAAAPWITVILLLALFYLIGGTFTSAKGVLFDLPDTSLEEGEATGLVALVMPMSRETLVFFDDARYMLGDSASAAAFGEHVAERAAKTERKTLLVLADRRVAGGELMKLAALAKKGGMRRVLFGEKHSEAVE